MHGDADSCSLGRSEAAIRNFDEDVTGARVAAFTNWRPSTGETIAAYARRVSHSRRWCSCGWASTVLVLEQKDVLSGSGYPQVRCRGCGSVRPHLSHRKIERSDPACGIYFIESGKGGPVKIGWAKDSAAERLTALQTGNPERLHLLGVVAGTVRDEMAVHRALSRSRIRGEWFAREPALNALERLRRGFPLDAGL